MLLSDVSAYNGKKGSFLLFLPINVCPKDSVPIELQIKTPYSGKHFHFACFSKYHLYLLFLIYQLLVLCFHEKPYPISQSYS